MITGNINRRHRCRFFLSSTTCLRYWHYWAGPLLYSCGNANSPCLLILIILLPSIQLRWKPSKDTKTARPSNPPPVLSWQSLGFSYIYAFHHPGHLFCECSNSPTQFIPPSVSNLSLAIGFTKIYPGNGYQSALISDDSVVDMELNIRIIMKSGPRKKKKERKKKNCLGVGICSSQDIVGERLQIPNPGLAPV